VSKEIIVWIKIALRIIFSFFLGTVIGVILTVLITLGINEIFYPGYEGIGLLFSGLIISPFFIIFGTSLVWYFLKGKYRKQILIIGFILAFLPILYIFIDELFLSQNHELFKNRVYNYN
jgi:hypothetical protein